MLFITRTPTYKMRLYSGVDLLYMCSNSNYINTKTMLKFQKTKLYLICFKNLNKNCKAPPIVILAANIIKFGLVEKTKKKLAHKKKFIR